MASRAFHFQFIFKIGKILNQHLVHYYAGGCCIILLTLLTAVAAPGPLSETFWPPLTLLVPTPSTQTQSGSAEEGVGSLPSGEDPALSLSDPGGSQ